MHAFTGFLKNMMSFGSQTITCLSDVYVFTYLGYFNYHYPICTGVVLVWLLCTSCLPGVIKLPYAHEFTWLPAASCAPPAVESPAAHGVVSLQTTLTSQTGDYERGQWNISHHTSILTGIRTWHTHTKYAPTCCEGLADVTSWTVYLYSAI